VTDGELARYADYVMTKGNTKSSPRVVDANDVRGFLRRILSPPSTRSTQR